MGRIKVGSQVTETAFFIHLEKNRRRHLTTCTYFDTVLFRAMQLIDVVHAKNFRFFPPAVVRGWDGMRRESSELRRIFPVSFYGLFGHIAKGEKKEDSWEKESCELFQHPRFRLPAEPMQYQ